MEASSYSDSTSFAEFVKWAYVCDYMFLKESTTQVSCSIVAMMFEAHKYILCYQIFVILTNKNTYHNVTKVHVCFVVITCV